MASLRNRRGLRVERVVVSSRVGTKDARYEIASSAFAGSHRELNCQDDATFHDGIF